MADIAALCGRLEAWLRDHLPAALTSLNPGATSRQIKAHEKQTGFALPDDVRGWFQWRNGQKRMCDERIFFGDRLLSLEESAQQWNSWQQFADMNEEIAPSCTSRPDAAILAAYSLPGWIPLAQSPGSSNYLGIDMNPGPTGKIGQTLYFGRDVEAKCVLGASFADFLEFIVEEMENGRITVGGESGEFPWTSHSLNAVDRHFEGLALRLHELGKYDGRRFHVDKSVKQLPPRG